MILMSSSDLTVVIVGSTSHAVTREIKGLNEKVEQVLHAVRGMR